MWETVGNWFGAVFKERTSSPLYGTFLFSWAVANWKIIYLTLFVDQDLIGNKIAFIERHYLDWRNLLAYPLMSTAVLIYAVPYLANETYKSALKFSAQRRDAFQESEKNRMLRLEESRQIIGENYELKESHGRIIGVKERDIKALTDRVAALNETNSQLEIQYATAAERASQLENMQSEDGFKVLAAFYFSKSDPGKLAVVTSAINRQIENGRVEFPITNVFFDEDPAPGERKMLHLVFQDDGGNKHVVAAEEKQTLFLDHIGDSGLVK